MRAFSIIIVVFVVLIVLFATPTLTAIDSYEAYVQCKQRKLRVKELVVEATAYTWTGNKTYTETWPKVGTVAVDPEMIPLGTVMFVEGYGFGRAEDTGSNIKGARIDVYLPSRKEALQWGRRNIRVYLLERSDERAMDTGMRRDDQICERVKIEPEAVLKNLKIDNYEINTAKKTVYLGEKDFVKVADFLDVQLVSGVLGFQAGGWSWMISVKWIPF